MEARLRSQSRRRVVESPAVRDVIEQVWPSGPGAPAIGLELVQLFTGATAPASASSLPLMERPASAAVERVLNVAGLCLARIQQRSLLSARVAARLVSPPQTRLTFAAAMLAGVGRLPLALVYPGRFAELARSSRPVADVEQAEEIVFGVSHAAVGAHLLARCGLPDPVVEAVAFQHRPGSLPIRSLEPVLAVHVARVLVDDLLGPLPGGAGGAGRLDGGLLADLELHDHLPAWRMVVEQEAFLPESV